MESYLTDRYQTVVVDGEKSDPMHLNYGLPQGATLAAKGFNLYVKPLGDIILKHSLPHKAYADDTNLYISFKTKDKMSKQIAISRLEACLKEIVRWMSQNMLKLNSEKTEVMSVALKNDIKLLHNVSINIENVNIRSISKIKSLGVIVDSTMSMKKQVNSVTRSAYHKLHKISRIRR